MHSLQFSVDMLKEYGERSGEALAAGVGVIPIAHMPPWDDLCSELPWEIYSVKSGSFGAKTHGFCGVYRLIALASEGVASGAF
jgi:hypothetical protein